MDRGAVLTAVENASDIQTDNESYKNEDYSSNDPNMINLDLQPEIRGDENEKKKTIAGAHPFHL
jgi:hypothetical protein